MTRADAYVNRALEMAFVVGCIGVASEDEKVRIARDMRDDYLVTPTARSIWEAIADQWRGGLDADVVTIAASIQARDGRDVLPDLLEQMARPESVIGGLHAQQHLTALRNLYLRRRLLDYGKEAASAASDEDVEGAMAYLVALSAGLHQEIAARETGDLGEVAARLEAGLDRDDRGITTGIAFYDQWSGGLHEGDIHVVAGPTGVGKTWMLSSIAVGVAEQNGSKTAIFTLEMSPAQVYARLLASKMGNSAFSILGRGARWTEAEYNAYLKAKPFVIEHVQVFNKQRSVAEICACVREYEPAVAMIDFVQLLSRPEGSRSEYEAMTRNADDLLTLAKETGVTLFLASQMSREALRATTSSPVLGGMGSSRWDQMADFWIHVERDELNHLVITNRKNRHGPTGGKAVVRMDRDTGALIWVSS